MPLLGSFGAGGWATLSGRQRASIYVPQSITPVEVLLVAGGGGASGGIGGGGGGGGVVYVPQLGALSTITYIVTVGGGGAGVAYSSTSTGGNASTFTATGFVSIIAAGGGGSGVHDGGIGYPGGSGGGAASNNSTLNQGGQSMGNSAGSQVASIYGNRGGNMLNSRSGGPTKGAGGGGAGGQGVDTNPNLTGDSGQTGAGAGGPGIQSSILGTSYYFGGGGGGGAHTSGTGGWGGLGGGGGGGGEGSPANGTGGGSALNSGGNGGNPGGTGGQYTGGGGGSSFWQNTSGGSGGSGIVVVRYPSNFPAATITGGGAETVANGYRTYRFNSAGTIKFPLDTVGAIPPPFTPTSVSGCVGWYNLDAVTTTQWTDQSGSANHAVINGATTSTVVAGNGATAITRILAGTTGQSITWPTTILPATYTLFHVTRYTGVTNSRIYQGVNNNWLSGHWGGLSGQFYHQGWLTDNSTNYHGNNWAIYTDQNSLGRSNKVQRGTGGGASDRLCINNTGNGEYSTWQTVECIVYNRTLTFTEYVDVENYLSAKYGI